MASPSPSPTNNSKTPNLEISENFNKENANEDRRASPELIAEGSTKSGNEKDEKNGTIVVPKLDQCANAQKDATEVLAEEQNNRATKHPSCHSQAQNTNISESIEEVIDSQKVDGVQVLNEEIVPHNSGTSATCFQEAHQHVGVIGPVSFISNTSAANESIYRVKWITTGNKTLPIIAQNKNGSCPLLAIINYLFLNEKINLDPYTEEVTSSTLMTYLGDCLFETIPKDLSDDERENYEKKIDDAISMFPKLQTGLDVNVGFTNISHFEYTPSMDVFDLLCIPLYHGWLVDPSDPGVYDAVGNATYNQVVEKFAIYTENNLDPTASKAGVAYEFVEATATQMTYHGLCQLASTLPEGRMGVLFRNNHFQTLLKRKGCLYLLMTDQGYLDEPGIVWETLDNIEGNSSYLDGNFRFFKGSDISSKTPIQVSSFANTKEQIDSDFMLALSLNEKVSEADNQEWANHGLSDHELALKLQEEEEKLARSSAGTQSASAVKQQQPSSKSPTSTQQDRQKTPTSSSTSVTKEKKESSCVIM